MSENQKTENQIPNVSVEIFNLLSPFTSEERQRVIKAALIMLGDEASSVALGGNKKTPPANDESLQDTEGHDLPARAISWMKQNSLVAEDLEQIFHFGDDGVDLIASDVPGKTNKPKTQSVYILCGILQLLQDGSFTFEDNLGRELCKNLGCYDHTNHTKALNDIGNTLTGDKKKGWTLTGPGQKKAVELIKQLNNTN